MNTVSKPIILGLLAVTLWSSSAVVAKIAESSVGYILLTVSTFIIGFITFLAVTEYQGSTRTKLQTLRTNGSLKEFILYSGCTGIFMGLYYYTYYFSIQSPYSVQANLINYLWPTLTPLFAALLFKSSDSISLRGIVALLISFVGCGVVVTGLSISSLTITIYHISAFVAAVSAALYMNFAMLAEEVEENLSLIYMIALGVSFPFVILPALTQPVYIQLTSQTFIYLIYVSVFTFVIANLTWTRSLIEGNTSRISSLAYFIPVFSTILLALVAPPDTPLIAVLIGGSLVVFGQVITED